MIFKSLKIWLIGTGIVLVVVFIIGLISNKKDPSLQHLRDKCRWSNNMSLQAITGAVQQKYHDKKNHNKPTLFLSKNKIESKVHFTNELSGFYNFIEIGDSINKSSNSLKVEITRNGEKIMRELNYGCIDHQN